MIFYNNYCKIKKAEVHFNEIIDKNPNLKEISKIAHPFLSAFNNYSMAYEKIFNHLITYNTRFNKLTSYSNVTENSLRGKEILNFLLVSNIVKPEFLTNEINFSLTKNSIILNSKLNNIAIIMNKNSIVVEKVNKSGIVNCSYSIIKKDNKDYLLEHKTINSISGNKNVITKEDSLTDTNSHKVEYYCRTSNLEDFRQNFTYINSNSNAYIIRKTGKEIACFNAENKPIAYSNNLLNSIGQINIKNIVLNENKKEVIQQTNNFKQVIKKGMISFEKQAK